MDQIQKEMGHHILKEGLLYFNQTRDGETTLFFITDLCLCDFHIWCLIKGVMNEKKICIGI